LPSLEVLTINRGLEGDDLLEIMCRALNYFPKGLWDRVNYLGDVSMKYDVKVRSRENVYNAFIFNNLIEKIKRIRKMLQMKNLLLAVTRDPVIAIYHRFKFEVEGISQVASLIHDYVSSDVGVVSLFRVDEEAASKIVAHGLGHNQGLRHHVEPIDIMYEGLLKHDVLNEGFCDDCIKRMLIYQLNQEI
jgi:predicted Zn-dependent protease